MKPISNKTLILLRHAEALDNNFEQTDYERVLSKKGIHDIHQLASFFIENKLMPDYILASSAIRTTQTANILVKSIGVDNNLIVLKKSLYNSSAQQIFEEICSTEIPNSVQTLLLIAHNPGISELASELLPLPTFTHLPPCGMMAFRLKIENWTDYPFGKAELLLQQFP